MSVPARPFTERIQQLARHNPAAYRQLWVDLYTDHPELRNANPMAPETTEITKNWLQAKLDQLGY